MDSDTNVTNLCSCGRKLYHDKDGHLIGCLFGAEWVSEDEDEEENQSPNIKSNITKDESSLNSAIFKSHQSKAEDDDALAQEQSITDSEEEDDDVMSCDSDSEEEDYGSKKVSLEEIMLEHAKKNEIRRKRAEALKLAAANVDNENIEILEIDDSDDDTGIGTENKPEESTTMATMVLRNKKVLLQPNNQKRRRKN